MQQQRVGGRSPIPRGRSPGAMTRGRSPGALPRGRSPGGRSPSGRSPKRGIREPSPNALGHSVRRERRGSNGGEVRSRRGSVSPAPLSHRRTRGADSFEHEESECVKVILRVRPFNEMEEAAALGMQQCLIPTYSERNDGSQECTGVNYINKRTQYEEYEDESHNAFHFDKVFYPDDIHAPPAPLQQREQEEVYAKLGKSCIDNLFDSYNSCVCAYGQTGSGKTHTMMGVPGVEGIIPRFCRDLLLRYEGLPEATQRTIKIQATFIEIYCEQLYDLMSDDANPKVKQGWNRKDSFSQGDPRKKLSIRQHPVHGICVAGANTFPVSTWVELEQILQQGMAARSTASTAMNDQSSRSHAMFQITMEMTTAESPRDRWIHNGGNMSGFRSFSSNHGPRKNTLSTASVRFVDLAGSENLKKSGSDGARMHESIHINTSLLALRRVIDQLLEKSSVPTYRDSKLTRLLSDCLGGNSKTWFLACVSPSTANAEETKNTLRYAAKATRIVNYVTRNVDVGGRIAADLVYLRAELDKARGDEVADLKALISQYESTQSELGADIEKLLERQSAADKEIEAARQEALELKTSSDLFKQRAEDKLRRAAQEASSYRKQLEATEKTVYAEREKLHRQEQIAKEKNMAVQQLEERLEKHTKRADEEKRAWEEIAIEMENEFTQRQANFKEQEDEAARKHRAEVEKLHDELNERHERQLKRHHEEHERELAEMRRLHQAQVDKARALEDENVKMRIKFASELAASEQRYEMAVKKWSEEDALCRKMNDQQRTRLADDVKDMRMSLEDELEQRHQEIADLKARHGRDMRVEQRRADEADLRARDAESRALKIETQFSSVNEEIRSMEEVHSRAQRILSAADDHDLSEHSGLLKLVNDVNSWGKQLRSLRTNYASMVASAARPDTSSLVPTHLDPVDSTHGRHRRSSSSRRLRKM